MFNQKIVIKYHYITVLIN